MERKWHEGRKDLNSTKMDQREETPLKKIPPGAWMFVSCEFCVLLSGRGFSDEQIPRPEESYRLWCVSQCDQKNYNLYTETGNRSK
jgi:hypothetical protein